MGIMPYQFEKGLFPTLLEEYFNEGLGDVPPTATTTAALNQPGPRARLRAIWRFGSVARFLRESAPADTLDVTPENSFIRSRLFESAPRPGGPDFQRRVAERWLGMTVSDEDGRRTFRRADPAEWEPGATLGHWHGYYGNVELIVAEAVQRLLEVSLGIDHVAPPPIDVTDADARDLERDLESQVTRVWPIYLFLTCPKPWFEAWVTWQCHSQKYPELRGQVTVILATPGHDRPVSPSPVDLLGDGEVRPDGRPNAYFLHGLDNAGDGYDGVYLERPLGAAAGPPVRRADDPTAAGGTQGMWVVTHENHDSAMVWTTFLDAIAKPENFLPGVEKPQAWDLPPIASYRPAALEERDDVRSAPKDPGLTGYQSVVVVKPAGRDGGAVAP